MLWYRLYTLYLAPKSDTYGSEVRLSGSEVRLLGSEVRHLWLRSPTLWLPSPTHYKLVSYHVTARLQLVSARWVAIWSHLLLSRRNCSTFLNVTGPPLELIETSRKWSTNTAGRPALQKEHNLKQHLSYYLSGVHASIVNITAFSKV